MERQKTFIKSFLKRTWFLVVLIALAGMVVGGLSCSSGGGEGSKSSTSCTSNSQCLNGQVCTNGSCVTQSNITKPSDPTNLTATAGYKKVALSWI